jgi:cyclophilin family peptidyl-prolyl cis-trans isomerase
MEQTADSIYDNADSIRGAAIYELELERLNEELTACAKGPAGKEERQRIKKEIAPLEEHMARIYAASTPNERVRFETTVGDFTMDLYREWAPLGFDRFMKLVESKFFDDQIIYRKLPGFLIQFGVAADPKVQAIWQPDKFADDEQRFVPFTKGTLSFAGAGANSRSSHVFISDAPLGQQLGKALHERAFGRINSTEEQVFLDNVNHEYGDITTLQSELVTKGNTAAAEYPNLTRITRCYVLEE